MSFFDYINAISFTKKDLFEEQPQHAEKEYIPFLVNRGLSYFPDTIMYVSEMNRYNSIPKQWQFDFLLNGINKRKRFSKWAKKEVPTTDMIAIQNYYKVSEKRAIEMLSLLNSDQINVIKASFETGGKTQLTVV